MAVSPFVRTLNVGLHGYLHPAFRLRATRRDVKKLLVATVSIWSNSAVEEPLDRAAGDLSSVPAEWSGRNGISVQVRTEYASERVAALRRL